MRCLLLALLALVSPSALAARDKPVDPTSRLIGLVEYVGGDYGGAVSGGKVINEFEYKEMVEFSDAAVRELERQKARFKPDALQDLNANLNAMKALVGAKSDAAAVSAQARTIRDRIIDALGVRTAPAKAPDVVLAAQIYGATCATCHGAKGHGDGAQAKTMDPLPRNFHEADVVAALSPYKVFNTLHTGVEGTKMEAYDETIAEPALWALAYFIPSWPQREAHPELASQKPQDAFATIPAAVRAELAAGGLSLSLLARSSEPELKAWVQRTVKGTKLDDATVARTVAVLRIAAPFVTELPQTAAAPVEAAPVEDDAKSLSTETLRAALAVAKDKTLAAKAQFAAGDAGGAEASLYDAYLDGYERLERRLRISHGAHVIAAEGAFIAARDQARKNDAQGFAQSIAKLEGLLAEAGTLLEGEAQTASGAAAGSFFASFIIILREGFEAFLIIGAILTLLTKQGQAARRKYVHFGWISASLAGLASYFVFTHLFAISGATRETIEAVCTGLAAIVLFYVSFWLLNQAERGRWERFLKSQAQSLTGSDKKTGALYLLAFIAVYREAAETVLFYAALGASSPSQSSVVAGFVAGCVVLLGVCWTIMRFGVRLPLRQFFLATSSLMIVISIVLAGKAMKEVVEAGYLKPTLLDWAPTIDALGIYQYGETLATQGAAILLAVVLVWLSSRQSPGGGLKPAASKVSAH